MIPENQRVTIRKYIVTAAKRIGKELLVQAAPPEIKDIATRKKTKKQALKNDFVFMSEHQAKHCQVQITETNLYVSKITITDFELSSIEKFLLKLPAIQNCTETSSKTGVQG